MRFMKKISKQQKIILVAITAFIFVWIFIRPVVTRSYCSNKAKKSFDSVVNDYKSRYAPFDLNTVIKVRDTAFKFCLNRYGMES